MLTSIKSNIRTTNFFGSLTLIRTFAAPRSAKSGGKVVGRKDNQEERKFLDSMQQLAFASEKAAKYRPRFPIDVDAKHRQIGIEYNKQTTILNNRRDKDLQTKMYLMHEAINALPDELKAKAQIVDRTPPPPNRPYPSWDTPPVDDFDIKEHLKKEAAETVGQESSDFV